VCLRRVHQGVGGGRGRIFAATAAIRGLDDSNIVVLLGRFQARVPSPGLRARDHYGGLANRTKTARYWRRGGGSGPSRQQKRATNTGGTLLSLSQKKISLYAKDEQRLTRLSWPVRSASGGSLRWIYSGEASSCRQAPNIPHSPHPSRPLSLRRQHNPKSGCPGISTYIPDTLS